MEEFYQLMDEAVKLADEIRSEYKPVGESKGYHHYPIECVQKIQKTMMNFLKEKGCPELTTKLVMENPEQKITLQREVIAVTCEGLRYEHSLIARL